MQHTIHLTTPVHRGLDDITREVEAIVAESGVQTGLEAFMCKGKCSDHHNILIH